MSIPQSPVRLTRLFTGLLKPFTSRRRLSAVTAGVAAVIAVVLLAGGCGANDSESSDAPEPEIFDTGFGETDEAWADEAWADDMSTSDNSFSGDSDDSEYAEATASEEAEGMADTGGQTSLESAESESAALAVPTAEALADFGRDIVYTATIEVESEDVSAAGEEAARIVAGLGGIVFAQNTATHPKPRITFTFKVLPVDFSMAVDRLASVGDLVRQRISAEDVTERIVDLESRVITSVASVARLRSLLESAADLDNIAQLERELLERESTLERLRGQLRTLRDQVDLATITLTIEQSPEVLPDTGISVALWVSEGDDDPCLGDQHVVAKTESVVNFCLEVENRGEAALTRLSLESEPLRLDEETFKVVEGGFDRIASGERLVATLPVQMSDGRLGGRVATRGIELWVSVTATPVDDDGEALPEISNTSWVTVEVTEDESLPGFTDAIGRGASMLVAVFSVALIAVGAAIPFLPIAAVVAAVVWWWRRRRGAG